LVLGVLKGENETGFFLVFGEIKPPACDPEMLLKVSRAPTSKISKDVGKGERWPVKFFGFLG